MLDTDHQVIAFPLSDRIAQNRLAQLDDVVAITASMVGVAELRDWEALTALQDQRDEMVREALSEGLPGTFAEAASEKIRTLLLQNDELLIVVAQAKHQLSQNYKEQRSQTQAVKRYLNQSA